MARTRGSVFTLFAVLSAFVASASASVVTEVSGNVVTAEISIGTIEADVTVTFENAIGLSVDSIGISASLLSVMDTVLLARLPSGMAMAAAFPLKIVIEPPDDEGLSFTGAATVEIHTHALSLVTNSPLRLMKAPVGGDFEDITASLASGSVRSRGRVGGFSEFVIAVDTRSHTAVADLKFDALDAEIDSTAIDSDVQDDLEELASDARDAFDADDFLDAVDLLEDLMDLVEAEAGDGIPDVWRASRDLDNVAGRLIADARTLMFSLRMANSFP